WRGIRGSGCSCAASRRCGCRCDVRQRASGRGGAETDGHNGSQRRRGKRAEGRGNPKPRQRPPSVGREVHASETPIDNANSLSETALVLGLVVAPPVVDVLSKPVVIEGVAILVVAAVPEQQLAPAVTVEVTCIHEL